MRRKIVSIIAAGVLAAVSAAGTAFAVVQYPPEGGTWDWGVSGSTVWSNYINTTPRHATSTIGQSGLRRSGCAGANQWARVSDTRASSGNKAYYRNTCP